jgi:hypothetical protein
MGVWCGQEDSNLHGVTRYHLKVVRLPIPPWPPNLYCWLVISALDHQLSNTQYDDKFIFMQQVALVQLAAARLVAHRSNAPPQYGVPFPQPQSQYGCQ